MDRINRIYKNEIYQKHIAHIAEKERDRKFCLHDLAHALDVARIGRIMIDEEGLDIDIELFYAAALLHDAGRYTGIPHNESGAMLAGKLMPLCGFTAAETETVTDAIRGHRNDTGTTDFSRVLYAADKRSRMCFCCKAADECYWDEDKRNMEITL